MPMTTRNASRFESAGAIGIEDAANQHGQDEVAATIAVWAEDAAEPDLADGAKRGGDVAVRQAAGDGEGVLPGGDDRAALEHAAQALDVGRGPVGQVAQGALTDLALVAVALAQENGGWRVPGSGPVLCHDHTGIDLAAWYKSQSRYFMTTFWTMLTVFCQHLRAFGSLGKREAGVSPPPHSAAVCPKRLPDRAR